MLNDRFLARSHNNPPRTSLVRVMFCLLGLFLFLNGFELMASAPVIAGFSPASGQPGDTIQISGTNFSSTASANIVYFGAEPAVVQSASASNLSVTVPPGATPAPITETLNNLTAYSPLPFAPGFPGYASVLSSNAFRNPVSINATAGQAGVAVADLDGDGRPDLITANYSDNTISIYRNISTNSLITNNTFASPVTISLGAEITGVAVGDLDGDGLMDVVACNPSGTLTILQNSSSSGTISFTNIFSLPAAANCRAVLVRDLDGDGRPEIMVASFGDSALSVYQNVSVPGLLSTASFSPAVNFSTPAGAVSLAAADLDGDGRPEVVTGNGTSISIFRNTSTAGQIDANTFAAPVNISMSVWGVAIGDIDGDGVPDLVAANQGNNSIAILRNTTTGPTNINFASPVLFNTGFNTYSVAIGNVSGDGASDIIAGSTSGIALDYFQNTAQPGIISTNSLAYPISLTGGSGPHYPVLADLDGDGRLDIVENNLGSGYLSIFQNNAPFAGVPVIVTQPAGQVAVAGTNVSFFVRAIGSTSLSYQWAMNGTNIAGATNSILSLFNVQAAAVGGYSVSVSNLYGVAVSSNAILSLSLPPLLLTQPADVTTNADSTVVFSVTALGSAPLVYQWSFNGANLPGATNSSLTLANVQTNNAGVYSITVSNAFGGTNSAGATLTVMGAPIITTQPAGVTVKPGGNAGFTVAATGALPLGYQWYFNGGALTNATSASLAVTNVQRANAGQYFVVVSNWLGSATSSVVSLTINAVPVITSFSPLSGIPGTNVTITGYNFDPVATNNIVYFGGVRAVVNSATGGTLNVTVPLGAGTESITETVQGLTAYSPAMFVPTFLGFTQPMSTSSFGPELDVPGPSSQAGISVADLDGDGKLDLITANYDSDTISIFRNISTNGVLNVNAFAAPIIIPVAGPTIHVAVGDLDGDGLLDLVADTQAGVACVFKNTSTPGNISFTPYFTITSPADSRYAVIRDIDGDGKPDVIMAGAAGPVISICQNIGVAGKLNSNSFGTNVTFPCGGYQALSVVAGDLNGDGKPDLVVGDNTALSIYPNISKQGIINSASLGARIDIGHASLIVAIGDIDGDGLPDVITGDTYANSMSVLRNTTSGINAISFASPVSFTAGSGTVYGVAIGDLDGDGIPDVAATTPSDQTISIFQNHSQTGTVRFASPVNLPTPGGVREVTLADLDGDGRLDISVANLEDSSDFTVYQNLLPIDAVPIIVTQPVSQNVAVGANILFMVVASGGPTISYQWDFNGAEINGATGATLVITNVQLNAAGLYSVTVSNTFGAAISSNAILNVFVQDHFSWSNILSPRFVNAAFSATIEAQDVSNNIVTNFTGTVQLSSTTGVAIYPPVTANFVQGVWTGNITISQSVTNLILRADDGFGHNGLANAINVANLPVLVTTMSGNSLLIYWPVSNPTFVLEMCNSLVPANWTAVKSTPLVIGNQYLLTVPIGQTNSFYRLRYSGP